MNSIRTLKHTMLRLSPKGDNMVEYRILVYVTKWPFGMNHVPKLPKLPTRVRPLNLSCAPSVCLVHAGDTRVTIAGDTTFKFQCLDENYILSGRNFHQEITTYTASSYNAPTFMTAGRVALISGKARVETRGSSNFKNIFIYFKGHSGDKVAVWEMDNTPVNEARWPMDPLKPDMTDKDRDEVTEFINLVRVRRLLLPELPKPKP